MKHQWLLPFSSTRHPWAIAASLRAWKPEFLDAFKKASNVWGSACEGRNGLALEKVQEGRLKAGATGV